MEGVWLLHPVACGPAASVHVGGFTRRKNTTEGERQKKNCGRRSPACKVPLLVSVSWCLQTERAKAKRVTLELSSHPHALSPPSFTHSPSLPPSLPPSLSLSSASLAEFTAHVSPTLAVQRLWRLKGYLEQKLRVSTGSPSLSPLWSHTGFNRQKNASFTSAESHTLFSIKHLPLWDFKT